MTIEDEELFSNGGEYLVCPHCSEVTHIGGLIGDNQTDCPCCGLTFEEFTE